MIVDGEWARMRPPDLVDCLNRAPVMSVARIGGLQVGAGKSLSADRWHLNVSGIAGFWRITTRPVEFF